MAVVLLNIARFVGNLLLQALMAALVKLCTERNVMKLIFKMLEKLAKMTHTEMDDELVVKLKIAYYSDENAVDPVQSPKE